MRGKLARACARGAGTGTGQFTARAKRRTIGEVIFGCSLRNCRVTGLLHSHLKIGGEKVELSKKEI